MPILRAILSFPLTSIIRAIMLLGCALFCCACSENRGYQEFVSPDGQTTAWLFTREGGATTAPSCQVSISKSKPTGIGNVYVQRLNEKVELKWLGNGELQIATSSQATILKHEANFQNIVIRYKML
jgi:hypothetical protein